MSRVMQKIEEQYDERCEEYIGIRDKFNALGKPEIALLYQSKLEGLREGFSLGLIGHSEHNDSANSARGAKRKRTVINRYSPMDIKEDDLFVYQGDLVRALPGAEEYGYTPGKFYEVVDCGYDIIRVNNDKVFCKWMSVEYFDKVES